MHDPILERISIYRQTSGALVASARTDTGRVLRVVGTLDEGPVRHLVMALRFALEQERLHHVTTPL